MSSPEETTVSSNEAAQHENIEGILGYQSVQEFLTEQHKLAAALQAAPVRRVLSPMVANPDLITM